VLHGDGQQGLIGNNTNSIASVSSSSSSNVQLYEQWSEDPLFSAATPPSLEQLQRKLVHLQRQLLQASNESLADILTGKSATNCRCTAFLRCHNRHITKLIGRPAGE
jgi:hypothetical protein